MIKIRQLTELDMEQAIELRILCWTEELAGKAENTLSVSEELDLWVDWMNTAKENQDIRLLIGAFENNKMLGIAFSSFAETFDIPEKGIEFNGLWVYPDQRNRGISLMMMIYTFDFYMAKGMEKMVVYNHHYSPSNQFYRKFGAQVAKQEYQMGNRLLVDVFLADMLSMKMNMEQLLKKYV
ncbi:GNAT family N-acetyltransferase [Clostridium frigidicarnis]|uniref:Acetyltransferase (GNAT) domain-containing protein n=1 Tax=Clostridium frigidicarnis TaxID=84698 RepID=A0A1I0XSY0_9CLOT|nr:GNAT family N-acetyltransferase [Clostridium frigidicarnis]SFB04112.1 Acetyltransferase (GNAT) domain-containing protein [Clostridium frigidicarnis]